MCFKMLETFSAFTAVQNDVKKSKMCLSQTGKPADIDNEQQ